MVCCVHNSTVYADAFSSSATSLGKTIYSGGSSFISGMAQSFGYVPDSYTYSFRVFNDTPGPIMAAIQGEANVMGATFAGDIDDGNGMNLAAFQDSGDTFLNKKLYLRVWLAAKYDDVSSYAHAATIGSYVLGVGAVFGGIAVTSEMASDAFFDKKITSLPNGENDKNVYCYHAFTAVDETLSVTVQGEYLGVKDVTSEFSGVFYNSIPETNNTEISLDFMKNGTTYTVTLEPNSFSLLQSSSWFIGSIRPQSGESRNFVFKQSGKAIGQIPISPVGIANVATDPNDPKKIVIAGPMTYTFEVYQKSTSSPAQVVMQGLNVGNFKQPEGRVRDINPLECKIWYASAQQTQEADKTDSGSSEVDYSSIPLDITDSLWLSYKTKDQTVQMKLEPGSVVDVNLLRPQVTEASASMYMAFIQSTNDEKSKEFLNRLHQGAIGAGATFSKITDPMNLDNIQTNTLSNATGIIQDTGPEGTGLTGYVVLVDFMYPRGLGSGPYYYSIPSPSLQLSNLASMLYFSDESYDENGELKSDVLKDFATKVVGWIQKYPTNSASVKSDVESYVRSVGNKNLFDKTDSTKFTTYATTMINLFLTGPISISKPPIIVQAGTNWYAFTMGGVPKGWPK